MKEHHVLQHSELSSDLRSVTATHSRTLTELPSLLANSTSSIFNVCAGRLVGTVTHKPLD